MRKITAISLFFVLILSLVGCKNMQSLSADDVKALIDTSYYSGIVFEERDESAKQNLAPFKQIDTKKPYDNDDEASALLNRFPMLSKFTCDKIKSTVYINGERYKVGDTLALSVLVRSEDKNLSAWPTLVFIKHGEQSGTAVYNSIRINTDSLRVPHFKDKDEDAEFGDGYFAYSLFVGCDEQTSVDCSKSPKELFSIDVSFPNAGHYTVKVIDSYKNGGKYTESLSLSGISPKY